MKKILYILLLVAMGVVASDRPVLADGYGAKDSGLKEQKGLKDECLLVAINCSKDFITLEQKIDKLQREIGKGRAVYSDEELRILREQLNNANKTLEFFKYEGAKNWYNYPNE
jgi:hypothetical protein